jgi:hypothetical protein
VFAWVDHVVVSFARCAQPCARRAQIQTQCDCQYGPVVQFSHGIMDQFEAGKFSTGVLHLLHCGSVGRHLTRLRRPLCSRARRDVHGCPAGGLSAAAPAARTPSAATQLGVESNLHRAP